MDIDETHTCPECMRWRFFHEFDSYAIHPVEPIIPRRHVRGIPGLLQVLLIDCHLRRIRWSRELRRL